MNSQKKGNEHHEYVNEYSADNQYVVSYRYVSVISLPHFIQKDFHYILSSILLGAKTSFELTWNKSRKFQKARFEKFHSDLVQLKLHVYRDANMIMLKLASQMLYSPTEISTN